MTRRRTALGWPRWPVVMLVTAGLSCASEPDLPTMESLGVTETEVSLPMCVGGEGERDGSELRVDTLASGLAVPWDVAFLPDGRALVTERQGRIRVVSPEGVLQPEPWAELDVYAREEVGLMGIDWRLGDGGRLEVYVAATQGVTTPATGFTRIARGAWRRLVRRINPEWGHPTTLEVVRIPEVDGRGGEPNVIVGGLPAFMLHSGGALRFGPDGLLYVTNGDATEPWTAHDPGSMRGKVLRFHPDGRPAGAEPGSPVFARGIRHVQGLDWHPETGALFLIDHGPSGLIQEGYRGNRDELNVVEPGDHLGWPIVTGTTRGGPFRSALVSWTPAIAPAGLGIYPHAGAWEGDALISGLRGETLRRIELERGEAGSWAALCEEIVFQQEFGRMRMVRVSPDGTVWLSTSNGDGRGVPRPEGELLLRVHPPAEVTR